MTIEKEFLFENRNIPCGYVVNCDGRCTHYFVYNENNFQGMIDAANSLGWKFRKDLENGTWTHFCPECVIKRMM